MTDVTVTLPAELVRMIRERCHLGHMSRLRDLLRDPDDPPMVVVPRDAVEALREWRKYDSDGVSCTDACDGGHGVSVSGSCNSAAHAIDRILAAVAPPEPEVTEAEREAFRSVWSMAREDEIDKDVRKLKAAGWRFDPEDGET